MRSPTVTDNFLNYHLDFNTYNYSHCCWKTQICPLLVKFMYVGMEIYTCVYFENKTMYESNSDGLESFCNEWNSVWKVLLKI